MAKKKTTKQQKAWKSALEILNRSKSSTLLIDADITVYHATELHTEEVQLNDDEWTLTCNVKKATAETVLRVEEMMADLRASHAILCFGSRSNWRKLVMPEYKAARKDRKPVGWNPVRRALAESFTCVRMPRLEADDLVGILHTMDDSHTVAVSEDKDFRCIPGLLYNPRKPDEGVIEITKAQANASHIVQTLSGDVTDGYKGCPGVGPVGAEKLLIKAAQEYEKNCSTAQKSRGEFAAIVWTTVVDAFIGKGLTEEDALANARVAWIMRWGNWNPETGAVNLWKPC